MTVTNTSDLRELTKVGLRGGKRKMPKGKGYKGKKKKKSFIRRAVKRVVKAAKEFITAPRPKVKQVKPRSRGRAEKTKITPRERKELKFAEEFGGFGKLQVRAQTRKAVKEREKKKKKKKKRK